MEVNQGEQHNEGVLLGLFTAVTTSRYKDIIVEEKTTRKVVSFRKKELRELISVLKKDIFNDFKIDIYRDKVENGQKNITESGTGQLGLF